MATWYVMENRKWRTVVCFTSIWCRIMEWQPPGRGKKKKGRTSLILDVDNIRFWTTAKLHQILLNLACYPTKYSLISFMSPLFTAVNVMHVHVPSGFESNEDHYSWLYSEDHYSWLYSINGSLPCVAVTSSQITMADHVMFINVKGTPPCHDGTRSLWSERDDDGNWREERETRDPFHRARGRERRRGEK